METKFLKYIITCSYFFLISCQTTNNCISTKNYLNLKDTSKPFNIESIYCIKSVEKIDSGEGIIVFKIWDRVTGNKIDTGNVFLTESKRIEFNDGTLILKVDSGSYNIGITTDIIWSSPFGIPDLSIELGYKYTLHCYVGGIYQY